MKYVRKQPIQYSAFQWHGQPQDEWPDFLNIAGGAEFYNMNLRIWDSKARTYIDVDQGDYIINDGSYSQTVTKREFERDFEPVKKSMWGLGK